MEPHIQYTRTVDGVNVAYMTLGAGPPVLYCPAQWLSMRHLMSEEAEDSWHRHALAAATRFTVLDQPGIGASQRDVRDFSLAAQLRAIEAVAARLDGRFTLVGFGAGSAGAALYATHHPERVREMVCCYPSPSIVSERFAASLREDWSLARRRLAAWAYPENISLQRWFGKGVGESTTADVAAAYVAEFARADLKEIYARIPVRTLMCVPPAGPDRDAALALASLVPDCRVAAAVYPSDGVPRAILEFMGVDVSGVGISTGRSGDAHATAVILFTDIADSAAATERLGDAAFRSASRALDERVRAAIRDAGGMPVEGKVLGDGVMGVFASAAQGIAAARACADAAAAGLPLHIGLHAGDVIREENNVYGGAVNIASRICALCAPGEILVSQTVRDLARTSAGVSFEDRGEHALKGIEDAVRVFAIVRASD